MGKTAHAGAPAGAPTRMSRCAAFRVQLRLAWPFSRPAVGGSSAYSCWSTCVSSAWMADSYGPSCQLIDWF